MSSTVTTMELPAILGFTPPPAALPTPRIDVALERREQAAQMVLAIAYGHCPEAIVLGIAPKVVEAFGIKLERDEALEHVDLLLDVLRPLVDEAGSG
jgi:hypothetical protein